MAGKVLTYAQQVQELKSEKQALIEENERLRGAVESEETLRNEIADLEAKVASQSNVENQGNVGLQGKLNDANERANSEAANAKRLRSQIETLTRANQVLEDGLQRFKDSAQLLEQKDQEIAQLRSQAVANAAAYLRKEQQFQDTLVAVNEQLNAQTNELRNLRLGREVNEKLVAQVRADAEKAVTEAAHQVQHYEYNNEYLRNRIQTAEAAVARYLKLVEEIPDTKAQLLAILNTVPDDKSTVT